jgi:creatinine amidohydrolase
MMHLSAVVALSGALLVAQTASAQQARPDSLPSVALPAPLDRVLRDYERAWRAADVPALVALFTADGMVLQPGRSPARGREAMSRVYQRQGGGHLRLRALSFAQADTVAYIVGAYGYGETPSDIGKFTLTLRRARAGRWLIASDMDNDTRLSPPTQIKYVAELNTREIQALDRAKTVVVLQGGMLEEHGPYLPAFTDGILSARLTSALAEGIASQRPGWTVLVYPPISVGASGYNEIGRQYSFAGTYAVRPTTLRAAFVDLANELGIQGFRSILVVHVHGSPLHIAALDDAGDFFHDTYGGTMVNLWGLLPVLGGWGGAMSVMTAEEKRLDGLSLHAGMDEHSLMLHLRPDLVSPDFKQAVPVNGTNYAEAFAAAQRPGWPGYVGAPHLATAAFGERIWRAFSAAAIKTAVEVLDGTDPSTYPRYVTYLRKLPEYRAWIDSSMVRDSSAGAGLAAWLSRRPQ